MYNKSYRTNKYKFYCSESLVLYVALITIRLGLIDIYDAIDFNSRLVIFISIRIEKSLYRFLVRSV